MLDPTLPLPAEKDLARRYGITLAQYLELLELQGGVCAICGKPPKAGRPLVVDHDHDTLEIAGLVHLAPCNRRLTQPVRRYLADPPGRKLGLEVPAELEAKTIARREVGKEVARTNRAARRTNRPSTDPPSQVPKLRAMTQPVEDDFAAALRRAYEATTA